MRMSSVFFYCIALFWAVYFGLCLGHAVGLHPISWAWVSIGLGALSVSVMMFWVARVFGREP